MGKVMGGRGRLIILGAKGLLGLPKDLAKAGEQGPEAPFLLCPRFRAHRRHVSTSQNILDCHHHHSSSACLCARFPTATAAVSGAPRLALGLPPRGTSHITRKTHPQVRICSPLSSSLRFFPGLRHPIFSNPVQSLPCRRHCCVSIVTIGQAVASPDTRPTKNHNNSGGSTKAV